MTPVIKKCCAVLVLRIKTHGVRYLDILYTVLTGVIVFRVRSVKHLKRLSGTQMAWGLFSDSEVLTIFCDY